jgi:hypothetical protein
MEELECLFENEANSSVAAALLGTPQPGAGGWAARRDRARILVRSRASHSEAATEEPDLVHRSWSFCFGAFLRGARGRSGGFADGSF